MKYLELQARNKPATQLANSDICARRLLKINCKTFPRKTFLLNFVNLATIFCPRLPAKIHCSLLGPGPLDFTFSSNFSIKKDSFALKIDI